MQARAETLADSGYRPADTTGLSLSLQQWVLRGETVSLNLAYPAQPSGGGAKWPLIVYQPGLGESAQGGTQWRQAWARAGYAVLSLQPLNEDALAWSSELARSADFKGLARHHYQAALLLKRQQVVEAALAEARQRAAAGDALWSRVNFERTAIVGYELGAQTALALAPQFRAAIVLSPVSTDAPSGDRPLLVIGSARDADPLGLLPTPSARRQWFDALPGGERYLLWLTTASHLTLAGGLQTEQPETIGKDGSTRPQRGGGGGGGEGRGKRGGGGGGMGGGGMGGGMGGGQGKGGASPQHQAPQADARDNPAEAAAVIAATSLAFLDAQLRQRPAALQWLAQEAETWSQPLGEWRRR